MAGLFRDGINLYVWKQPIIQVGTYIIGTWWVGGEDEKANSRYCKVKHFWANFMIMLPKKRENSASEM